MADVVTLRVKMRKAAKNYPAFGVTKGQQIFKWREKGQKFISLTDPRNPAPVSPPVGGGAEVPVTKAAQAKKAPAKPGLRKAAKAKAPAAEVKA